MTWDTRVLPGDTIKMNMGVYIIYYMNYNTHMQPMLLVYLPT